MNVNLDEHTDQQQYERLLANVKDLEAEIMPKLELLGKEIPEIYNGYAKLVRESVDNAIQILNLKETTSNRVMMAAEIGARTIEAYGAWKAAREHNQMLDKFLTAKRQFAALNYTQIKNALEKANSNLAGVKRLFNAYAKRQYDLSSEDETIINKVSNLILRHLVLYRTALFLATLCSYLKAECEAWSQNQQVSSMPRTDYYIINGKILNELFGDKIYEELEKAADSSGNLSGAQIMLLSDPQLSIYALKDTLCKINYNEASRPINTLIENNPSFPYYNERASSIVEKINDSSIYAIYLYALLSIAAVISLCIWFIPGVWWSRVIIGVIACSGIFRITSKNAIKIKVIHVDDSLAYIAKIDDEIESYCGKVQNNAEIDYERKDAILETLKTFFK